MGANWDRRKRLDRMNGDDIARSGCVKPIRVDGIDRLRQDLVVFRNRSWSGRIAGEKLLANAFILEAIECLENSLTLFEAGYFDCAFYCLRSSIELSTTVAYLYDVDDGKGMEFYSRWTSKESFLFRARMMKKMSDDGGYFSDMREGMGPIFGEEGWIERTNGRLNKHVHKQGYDEFYVIRNNPLSPWRYDDRALAEEFVGLFRDTLGIVAVMRLIIDPFPVLLMDPEIDSRCPELEEPYDERFVSDYIPADAIEGYRETRIYREAYDSFMKRERCCQGISDIKRHWIYDRRNEPDIRAQMHLLNSEEAMIAELVFSCPKIVRVTDGCGILLAQTETHIPGYSNRGFFELCRNGERNVSYGGRYISSFGRTENVLKWRYYLDHLEPFDEDEMDLIAGIIDSVER